MRKEKKFDRWILISFVIIVTVITIGYIFINYKLKEYQTEELIKYANCIGAMDESGSNMDEIIKKVLSEDISKENVYKGLERLNNYGYFEGMDIQNKWIGKTFVKIKDVTLGVLILISLIVVSSIWVLYYRDLKKLKKINVALEKVVEGKAMEPLSETEEGDIGLCYHNINTVVLRLNIGKEKLKEERDRIRELLSELSHQLKTPIAGIKMNNELILEGYVDDSEKNEFLRENNENIDRMEWITTGLIKLSTLESKSINLNKKESSISETLLNSINGVHGKALEKNITINILKFDEGNLRHDKKWLGEAIINILDNSIKYSLENKEIDISLEIEASKIKIIIKDRGFGIKKEDKDKIFKRFYRSYSEEIRNEEGSGIGLYLSKKIIEDHNGNIKVKSEVGKGSTFTITLYKHLID
ncbi:MAG: sensor histidine kinase [Clostridium sp.]|uniref:sensor histidine kinase n=1 Tax=Clostridium sp. TaxID=1506 RepID=UPI003F411D93